MKTRFNRYRKLLSGLILVLPLILSNQLIAQQKKSTDLKDFKLVIENSGDEIRIESVEGSAWVDLSFSIVNYQTQAIDEYGMTELENTSVTKDGELADFLFTITKTRNGIELKGLQGTAWTDLKFSLAKNKKQAIDQFGMTN